MTASVVADGLVVSIVVLMQETTGSVVVGGLVAKGLCLYCGSQSCCKRGLPVSWLVVLYEISGCARDTGLVVRDDCLCYAWWSCYKRQLPQAWVRVLLCKMTEENMVSVAVWILFGDRWTSFFCVPSACIYPLPQVGPTFIFLSFSHVCVDVWRHEGHTCKNRIVHLLLLHSPAMSLGFTILRMWLFLLLLILPWR